MDPSNRKYTQKNKTEITRRENRSQDNKTMC